MYLSEKYAQERQQEMLDHAAHARRVRTVREMHRLIRSRERAEQRLLEAWRRADEFSSRLESFS